MAIKKAFLLLGVLIALLSLRPPQAFALSFGLGQCTGKGSICDLNPTSEKPGDPCGADPVHYVYGHAETCVGTQSPCVPACGIVGNGRCCDPNPKNPPKVSPTSEPGKLQPPPCADKNIDPKKGCAHIDTAIGTISTSINDVVMTIFKIILGISGGVAVLLIIGAGYQMMTSQGNPEKVKEARERLTSAIIGLVFILFSVAILQIIGVDILQLPGFTR